MAVRLKTLFFVLLLTGSVYSGTPFQRSGMDAKVCPMKCCKKAQANKEKYGDSKYLCRVLVCSQSVPTTQTAFSPSSIAPVFVEDTRDPGFEALFVSRFQSHHETAAPVRGAPAQIQPIYLKIHSLLI